MSFQDIAPPSATEDHQLYDMDQPPVPQNVHDTGGPPGGHPPNMGFMSSGPNSGNFGSFGPIDGPGAPCGPTGGRSGPMSGSDIALQWQQGHYMGANNQGAESGFVSGAATGPSSQTGHDDLEGDGGMGYHTGPGSITGSSLYDLDGGHQSELSSLQSSIAGVHNNPEGILPELIDGLVNEDQVVVLETQTMVEKLTKKDNFFSAMIRNFDFVSAVVESLVMATSSLQQADNALQAAKQASGNNTPCDGRPTPQQKSLSDSYDQAAKRTRLASNIIRTMTNCTSTGATKQQLDNQMIACHKIVEAQGVPPITQLLMCTLDRIRFNAVATIHSLLLCIDSQKQNPQAAEITKNQIRETGGIETMVELLKEDNVKLMTILTDCLRILATKNQPTKDTILARQGPQILVEIMQSRHQEYKNLIVMTTKLLRVLSCCPKSKRAMFEAGGMHVLGCHMSCDQPRIILNCMLTMRNMSDLASGIQDGENLCIQLVQKLSHPELVIVSCAAGILANLTANNERLKLVVCESDGVTSLVHLLGSVPLETKDGRDTFESTLSVLKHLTNNHQGAEQVQRIFVFQLDGLAILDRRLHPSTNRPGLKGILQIVSNLCSRNPDNHETIQRLAIPEKILRILEWSLNSLQTDPKGNSPCENGVRFSELVDVSLRCVFGFCKEPIYKDVVRNIQAVQLFKNTLSFFAHQENKGQTENIVKLATAIIEFICIADLEGAYIIFREGLEETVINLTNHPNQKIVDSANSILHAMNNMKNQEQQGKWHPPRHLQQHTQIQNPNLQNIPPSGGNGFRQGPMPNQQGAQAHMQSGGSPGYHPRNQPQQQSPMHSNPGFEQMMSDSSMHGSGPPGQPNQMPMGHRDQPKPGSGFHQTQNNPRGPPPDARMGGPSGYDDMSMEMGNAPYNANFPDYMPM